MIDLPAFDVEAMKADMDRQIAEVRAMRKAELAWNQANLLTPSAILNHTMGPARFNFLSLPAWLAVAERANVPFIPATECAALEAEAFTVAIDGEENADAFAFLKKARLLGEDEMVRFEQCGPGSLKSSLSQGQGVARGVYIHPDTQEPMFDIFDPRTYETFQSLGASHFRAYRRPLVKTATQKGVWQNRMWDGTDTLEGEWPVEFRVFIREGQVSGVSNYYPQMTLPDAYLVEARDAAALAQTMVEWMHRTQLGVGNGEMCADTGADEPDKRAPWVPEAWGSQDFTLDFILKENGDITFLEGGPGGFRQAAPCCFENGPMGIEHMLTGIKLGLESQVHPL